MQRDNPSFGMIRAVAVALGDLRDTAVFVGGAITCLLVTDPAAPPTRATDDVDIVVGLATTRQYHVFEEQLRERGFRKDMTGPIGRFLYGDQRIDVMPAGPGITGDTNRWYGAAMRSALIIALDAEISIRCISGPCFLATKLEAFAGRGAGDFISSHDIEDIIAVVDGRAEIVDEVRKAEAEIRAFVGNRFRELARDASFIEAISGHLQPDDASQGRQGIVLERIQAIADLS